MLTTPTQGRRQETATAFHRPMVGGFTLIEVLVTTALLGLVLLLFAPGFNAMRARRQLQGSAEETATLLRRARYEAITQSRRTGVGLEPGQGFFLDADVDGVLDPHEPQGGLVRLPAAVVPGGPDADPQVASGLTPVGDVRVAVYEPTGGVLAGGAFRLSDRRGNHLEVRLVDAPTAPVTVRKWDGAGWREQGEGGERWEWH